MTQARAGSARAIFEIKSAHLPLVSMLLKSVDLALLSDAMAAQFGDAPDFFDHDPLLLDFSLLEDASAVPDFATLMGLLRRYRLQPLALRGGSAEQVQAAVAAGLLAVPAVPHPTPARAAAEPAPVVHEVIREVPVVAPGALLIDKPLRSGQRVYAHDGDLVLLAMVNPGAEVIADGNIHVYAPLRGKAIAGARGNTAARILTLCLEPELVSIAGIYRTGETEFPADLRGHPAQIRLDGERLVMQALKV